MTSAPPHFGTLLRSVAERVRAPGVFGEVRERDGRLECQARAAGDEAWYRLEHDGVRTWVSLVTPARYLSQSIEADLVHTGDKLHELLHDELIDQGVSGAAAACPPMEHFRSTDKLFTFRTVVPIDGLGPGAAADLAARYLLAMQACFAPLGDMSAQDDDE